MKKYMLPNLNDDEVLLAGVFKTGHSKYDVVWAFDNKTTTPWDIEISAVEAVFKVRKHNQIIHVEAYGWYDSDFHFAVSITHDIPAEVVLMAFNASGLVRATA